MSILAEFSVIPIGTTESLSGPVARCLEIVEASGLPYRLGPMGTTIEGQSPSELFVVVEKCLQAMQKDFSRVEVILKVDWRAGDESRLDAKVASVQAKVGHALKT